MPVTGAGLDVPAVMQRESRCIPDSSSPAATAVSMISLFCAPADFILFRSFDTLRSRPDQCFTFSKPSRTASKISDLKVYVNENKDPGSRI